MTEENTEQSGSEVNPEEQPRDSEQGNGEESNQGWLNRFVSARRTVSGSFDRLTGTEYRQQFEEFTNIVSTVALGIHRDQTELSSRLGKIEDSLQKDAKRFNTSTTATSAFALSILAVILGLIAVIRTF